MKQKTIATILLIAFVLITWMITSGCGICDPTPEQKAHIDQWRKGDIALIKLNGQTGMVTRVFRNGCYIKTYQPNSENAYDESHFEWYEFEKLMTEEKKYTGGLQ